MSVKVLRAFHDGVTDKVNESSQQEEDQEEDQ